MKISFNWLKTLLPLTQQADEVAALLTGCGLEVENHEKFETVKGSLRGLIVGEVLDCQKHPGADRLSLTKVNIGSGVVLSIVCGAPNVAKGQKVIVATPGTTLYPVSGEPFVIKKSKIRGEASEGMICAEDEIGLGNNHEGILVLPDNVAAGTPATECFSIDNDEVFEIGLTPNRGDAASHFGVARDLAAVLNAREHTHSLNPVLPGLTPLPEESGEAPLRVNILDQGACPRYSGIVITGIKVGESPSWLKNRLKSIGLRSLNNIIDITNFVLHETGQPLHAFDLAKIDGAEINVRRAAARESLVTLDGVTRQLTEKDLVICDKNKPMCIAGVFGGAESGVAENTTAIFLESAFFDAPAVRNSSKFHQLKTDASFRFERGTDPEMTVTALQKAVALITEIAGGTVTGSPIDIYPEKLAPFKVAFSYKNCNELTGKELDRNTIKHIILSLGMTIDSEGTDGLLLYVPRYKHDVTREADVIEEVLRIHGYDHIEPSKHLRYTVPQTHSLETMNLEEVIAGHLSANGFNEIMNLSLDAATYYENQSELVQLLNPLSNELNILRPDLLHGGLGTIAHNINRRQQDLKMFEFGRIYKKTTGGEYTEKKQLSLFACGELFKDNPHGLQRTIDFSFLSSTLNSIFTLCGIGDPDTEKITEGALAFGLRYTYKNRPLAEAGQVSAGILKRFDIKGEVYYAAIEVEVLLEARLNRRVIFTEPTRFPAVRRDLALLIDKKVMYRDIEELARKTEKKLLTDVSLFDVYEDSKLGDRRSYAVRFTLQDKETTLTDKQIDAVMEKLIRNYREKLGAEIR